MKILHLSYTDSYEGAAIAAERLHNALMMSGEDSTMLVKKKRGNSLNVYSLEEVSKWTKVFSKLTEILDVLLNFKYRKISGEFFTIHSVGSNIMDNPFFQEADIIHIHWVGRGFLSLNSIEKMLKSKKKFFWTLHDNWSFTGGCHVRNNCNRFEISCGLCPEIESVKKNDMTKKNIEIRKKLNLHKNLTYISPSEWMASNGRKSYALKDKNIKVIPNTINTEIFKEVNSKIAKDVFNIITNKKVVLFQYSNNKGKGLDDLFKVFILLRDKNKKLFEEIQFVSFGKKDYEIEYDLDIIKIGKLYDEYSMVLLYNCADIYVSASYEESFGQTFLEAISCGISCCAYNNSGQVDIIKHKKNGYLAKYRDIEDMKNGIEWLLEDENRIKELKCEARKIAKGKFGFDLISKRMIDIYEENQF